MSYEPTTKERIEDARPYILPVICGVIVLGLVGWVVWYQFGPGKTARSKPTTIATPDDAAKTALKRSLESEIDALEKAYQRAVETGETSNVLDSLLTRAIERQRELLNL